MYHCCMLLPSRSVVCGLFLAFVVGGFVGELLKLELREAKEIFSALVFMNVFLTTY